VNGVSKDTSLRNPSGINGYDGRGSEQGIRGYRRWNRGLELDVYSCGKKDGSLVQVVGCGWKAQPRLCINADLWLVQTRWLRR
jgi:hypothetical protein